ncbi:hypothetical protein BDA99DRAFT_556312 [Phascolomyces articulosus]|uniref:Uncharacterized protein n=1 Tax=Phascolomyces articulosus TaxID=60185 RepID=A0AAD5PJ26_9FUNG|nr:hypothetical protein BDA99DRAFT_556312 [Phascolomyces articulosus]
MNNSRVLYSSTILSLYLNVASDEDYDPKPTLSNETRREWRFLISVCQLNNLHSLAVAPDKPLYPLFVTPLIKKKAPNLHHFSLNQDISGRTIVPDIGNLSHLWKLEINTHDNSEHLYEETKSEILGIFRALTNHLVLKACIESLHYIIPEDVKNAFHRTPIQVFAKNCFDE